MESSLPASLTVSLLFFSEAPGYFPCSETDCLVLHFCGLLFLRMCKEGGGGEKLCSGPPFCLFLLDIQPPDGKPKDCLLQIVCRDGKTISLCAESTDDCL